MISKAEIKKIKSLHSKKGRELYNLILIEGKRLIEQVVNSQYNIDKVWMTEDFQNKNLYIKNVLQNIDASIISNNDIKKISSTKNSSGILGVIRMPISDIKKISVKIAPFVGCEIAPKAILRAAILYLPFITKKLQTKNAKERGERLEKEGCKKSTPNPASRRPSTKGKPRICIAPIAVTNAKDNLNKYILWGTVPENVVTKIKIKAQKIKNKLLASA